MGLRESVTGFKDRIRKDERDGYKTAWAEHGRGEVESFHRHDGKSMYWHNGYAEGWSQVRTAIDEDHIYYYV